MCMCVSVGHMHIKFYYRSVSGKLLGHFMHAWVQIGLQLWNAWMVIVMCCEKSVESDNIKFLVEHQGHMCMIVH